MDERRRPVVMLASGSKDGRGHVYGRENVAGGKRRRSIYNRRNWLLNSSKPYPIESFQIFSYCRYLPLIPVLAGIIMLRWGSLLTEGRELGWARTKMRGTQRNGTTLYMYIYQNRWNKEIGVRGPVGRGQWGVRAVSLQERNQLWRSKARDGMWDVRIIELMSRQSYLDSLQFFSIPLSGALFTVSNLNLSGRASNAVAACVGWKNTSPLY